MPTPVRSLILIVALLGLSGWQADVVPKKLRTSGARKALDAWSRARAWPDSFVPDEGHFRGFLAAESMAPVSVAGFGAPGDLLPSSHGAGPKWRSMGPLNIGGRTLSVTLNPLNPLTVYAGSAGGGLWVSRTGGIGVDAWRRVVTGFPVTSASCLAIAPNDTSVMYLGTGEVYAWQNALGGLIGRGTRGSYGFGILKSIDAGQTWSMCLDWSRDQKRGVWAIRIDPEEPNRVWAATTEGIYRSTDAGLHWSLSLNVVMGMDIELDPQNPDTAFAACGNFASPGYGIYRTLNGGTNWTKLAGGLPSVYGGKAQIVVSPEFTNVVYVGIGGIGSTPSGSMILRSFDNGTSWVQRSATIDYSSYQYWYSHDIAIQPNNYENVWACGIDLWKSTSGGTSPVRVSDWQLAYAGFVPIGGPEGPATYVHAEIHAITFHPSATGTIYFATDGGVFRTTNGGTSYESCNGGYATSQFYPGFAVASSDTVP
ncbi:MAG: Glycosyl hydrolase, partial [bacterium]